MLQLEESLHVSCSACPSVAHVPKRSEKQTIRNILNLHSFSHWHNFRSEKRKNNLVEKKNFRINNVEAAIFLLKSHTPPMEKFEKWKDLKINILTFDRTFSDQIQEHFNTEKNEINVTHVTTEMEKSRVSAKLRSIILEQDLTARLTVLFADDPHLIRAAQKKGLYLIAGIATGDARKKVMYEAGAHIVLENLDNVRVFKGTKEAKPEFSQHIPGLFDQLEYFENLFRNKKPVFFFDYDGTLSKIVENPEDAVLNDKTRQLLHELAMSYTVAVVSGRDKSDIQSFVDLKNVIYAGSHGFRITGPDGMHMEMESARELLPRLDQMEKELKDSLEQEIPGVMIERKYFAIAIHYRNAPRGSYTKILEQVKTTIGADSNFKRGRGKKILEIKPALNWHKGKALEWIMDQLGFSWPEEYLPIYVGDDVTDEDAFRTLCDDGVGILVGQHSLLSAANYRLENVDEVDAFLKYLVNQWQK
jgi:trehalose-phosphatase